MNNCSHAKDFSWMENGTLVKVEGEAVTVRESPSVKEEDAVIEEMTVTDNLSGVEEEIGTDTPNTNSLQISLTVSEEEVPSEQQHCKREWSPSLGQEDPQPGQIKEEPKELWIGQEREQLQGLFEDFIFTPPCVKSERQKDSLLCEPILAGFPTLRRLEISKLESFRVLFNDHLTVSAAVEVFEAIEKRIAKYEEENDLFRRLMRITPETKPCETDALQLFLAVSKDVPAEQQHCKRGWNSSLGQEDPEPTQIKEGQKELRIGQDEEPFFDSKDLVFPLPCVKNDCDQKDPCQKFPTLNQLKISKLRSFCVLFNAQAQAAEGVFRVVEKMLTEYQRENDWLRRMLWITPEIRLCRIEVTPEQHHCKQEWSPSLGQEDPEPTQIKEERHIGQEVEPVQQLFHDKCVKRVSYQEDQTSIMLSKNHYHDKGKMFALKADLQGRVTAPKERPIECIYCRKCYNSTSKLKAHVRLLHRGKPCPCKYCGKPFKHKGDLSKHMRSHTGEKPFSCGDCGKSFSVTKNLTRHKLIHTGEKPFHCDDCGLNFSLKRNLNRHQLIHTGEKPFKCDDCGRSFRVKESLTDHMRTHTGEKPLRCGECGNSFNYKQALKRHMLTHSRETKL
ncbi:zinc finger protein 519 isoform X12 [Esox lucius]|uniref:zinc finger protein 519 isoform X12 n=1 Tax=Esox lucius TaxID=8010 RepID=UPI0010BDAA4D|nr:zinc finger protein 519 isoform X12 [Esox lucius]